jgi:mRNA interferase MazF
MRKGAIVLIPFPFTDLSGQKIRPALVLVNPNRGSDCIVAFITSGKGIKSGSSISISKSDENGLKTDSYIQIDKIATLQKGLILGEIGCVDKVSLHKVTEALKKLFDL